LTADVSSTIQDGPKADPAPRKADVKADLIRKAAYQCFARSGYFGTTVDLICADAKISKGAFYWHFDSKQALFLEILNHWADEVEGELTAQFRTALAQPDAFPALERALRREAHRGRAILPVWFEFLAQVGRNSEMRAVIANFHKRIRDALANLLAPALHGFDEPTVRAFASTVLAAFIGLVGQDLADPHDAPFEETSKGALALLQHLVARSPNVKGNVHE
jgi:AcrR family transcriptional regulator